MHEPKKASWQTKLSPRKDVWMQACNIQSIRQKDSIWGIHCGFCGMVLFRLKTVFKSLKENVRYITRLILNPCILSWRWLIMLFKWLLIFFNFQIPYQSKVVQIKFLQSLHDKAEQEITFHCKNSVAYRDAQSKSKDRAILLTTFNGDWLGANNKKKFRYKVTEDGCQVTASIGVTI